MARKPTVDRKNGDDRPKFVNFDFDKGTKEKFKKWAHEQAEHYGDLIERLLDDGYNVSIKRDVFNDCIAAYLAPQDKSNPNYGWLLAGRGSTAFGAVMGCLYRHYVVFEGTWPVEDTRRVGLDDE